MMSETHEVVKRVEIKGNNYCLNNGFNKLGDCILVSNIKPIIPKQPLLR